MSAQTDIAAAKRFADVYKPSDEDHASGVASRVAMFERAVKDEKGTGRTRAQAVHARSLLRDLRQRGIEVPKAPAKKTAKKTAGS